MSRRTLTLAVAGFLVVLLSAVAALLPVPYVALEPGPVTNTLGEIDGTPLIEIEGRRTYPGDGQLYLTTVSVIGGPRQRLDLVTALRGWLDDSIAVIPEEQVYPAGETAEQIERQGALEMRDSQENATTAALRELGVPVQTTTRVVRVPKGSPSRDKLRRGDVLLAVDGTAVTGGAQLRELIMSGEPGEQVRVEVRRGDRELTYVITTAEAPDGRTIIGVETRDAADYPFKVDISLADVGGPSAGLMFALGIVEKLTPGSLTGGRHVAGTGSIDDAGKIGPIGGITQKMLGAKRAGATVFLSPPGNCAEAKQTKPAGLRLVRAESLSSAARALDLIREGRAGVPRC